MAGELAGTGSVVVYSEGEAARILGLGRIIVHAQVKKPVPNPLTADLLDPNRIETMDELRTRVELELPKYKSVNLWEKNNRGVLKNSFNINSSMIHEGKWRKLDPDVVSGASFEVEIAGEGSKKRGPGRPRKDKAQLQR